MECFDSRTEVNAMESIRVYLVLDDELVSLRAENAALKSSVEELQMNLEQMESRYRLEVEYNLRLQDENRELNKWRV